MKKKTGFFLSLIVLLAFFLRIFKLESFPPTLYGDEQAFAWNAYNILKLGEDEYGNRYPLQFRSFDDYKSPIPVYLLVPFIQFYGLEIFAIRLPIALASILTVLVTYFLVRLFFPQTVSLLATFLLAISPWHLHLSRGFFEATLALLWFVLGIYFFLRNNYRIKNIFLGMLFFALSLYSYFTPRILVPIFLIFLFCFKIFFQTNLTKKFLIQSLKIQIFGFVFLFFLSLPLLRLTFFDKGLSRLNKLISTNNQIVIEMVNRERNTSNLSSFWRTIFHNKATIWLRLIKNNYLEHLSLNFWYIYGDNSLRYFLGNRGMFYLWELPFFILGIYFFWQEKKAAAIFFLGWILLAPIPASLVGRSFAVRSLAILPAPFIFVGYGLYRSNKILKKLKPIFFQSSFIFPFVITLFPVFSVGIVLIRYYFEYPIYAATWWGWENKAAIDYAKKREKEYEYIFISDFYTGSTLAYAVYNQYDPLEYRKAIKNPIVMADGRHLVKLGKYYFGSLDIDEKRLRENIIPPNSLYLARPEEADSGEAINAPDDGRVIFKIYKTDSLGRVINL